MGAPVKYPATAAGALMRAARLRWCELSARSGCCEVAVRKVVGSDIPPLRTETGTLFRVAAALGAAPAELWPILAVRPRTGLLWERGVFTPEGTKGVKRTRR